MNISGWGLASTICLSVVYGPYAADMGYHIVYLSESVIYNALARCGWAVALAYVIMSCALGQGGENAQLFTRTEFDNGSDVHRYISQ